MVTATQLSSYIYCQRKLFLSNVLFIKEPNKKELIKGKIWHETHEVLNDASKKLVCSIKDSLKDEIKGEYYNTILDMYRRNYSKFLRNIIIKYKFELSKFELSMIEIFNEYWPDIEEEAKDAAINVTNFIKQYHIYGEELWNKLTPKILSEQYFKSDRLALSGVIDIIEIHDVNGTKSYIPIELKTGSHPKDGMWEGHRIQLAAYVLLLEDSGKVVSEAVIKYKGSEKRSLLINSFLKEEVKDIIFKTSAVLKSSIPPKHTDNKTKCKTCYFKEVCYDNEKIKELLTAITQSKNSSLT